ncbi:MAG: hypothetical protein VB048_07995 [Bacteroidaceae bacterium]|nr:hypothetical protein [Bacteroidaceae bacterium]MEA5099131.1 hypothetical protein [Bacteroidales bacterium]
MKIQLIISLSVFLFLSGCSSVKKPTTLIGTNLKEIAINIAIQDFSTNCNLFKKDSVFRVSFEDSVFYKGAFVRVDEKKYKDGRTHQFERGDLYEGIVSVGITKSDYQYYYSEEKKDRLPTRHVIIDGKLFYWWDQNYSITEEMIAVLWKYNRLQKDLIISNFSTDDSQNGADYYFCKNNLSKYKRVITNIGFGYYNPPKLKCK